MELKEFIKTAISDIYEAIKETNEEKNHNILPIGYFIIPEGINRAIPSPKLTEKTIIICNLQFETILGESEVNGVKTGLGVLLGSVGVGVKGSNSDEHGQLSKIKFNIPINLSII